MSDRLLLEDDDGDVGRSLRALPLLQPPRSAWPGLRTRLPAPRRVRTRPTAWLALAGSIALLALIPRWAADPAVAPMVPAVVDAPDAMAGGPSIDALMRESSQLEQWIAWSHTSGVDSGPDASLASGLSERIQQIDALLERADLATEANLPLWQERVLRLRQLAHIENTDQLMAARGESDAGLPVLAF